MQKIIDETKERAYQYLKEFGFEENEIVPVVSKGIFELTTTLEKLRTLLVPCHEYDLELLDDLLHALKGLLFQLGNHLLAERIEELRVYDNTEILCEELKRTLYLEE